MEIYCSARERNETFIIPTPYQHGKHSGKSTRRHGFISSSAPVVNENSLPLPSPARPALLVAHHVNSVSTPRQNLYHPRRNMICGGCWATVTQEAMFCT